MTILASDISIRLSGGSANSVQIGSLGGVKSSSLALATLFDNVNLSESLAGDIEYRCIYVHNSHSTDTLNNAVAWITSNTPSSGTAIYIGLGTSAMNATEQTIADENTTPSGITFVLAASKAGGVALGNIPAGQSRALWLRRVVNASTSALTSDPCTIRVEGETT